MIQNIVKKKLFYLISVLIIFVSFNIFVDFNYIFQLLLNGNFRDFINENYWEYFFIFLLLNTIYIFFLGFGSISLILAIILFEPITGLVLCVMSKTIGSTFYIIFFQKNIFNQVKINYKKNFLKKLLKVQFLFVAVLRIIPGLPVQIVNSTISYLKVDVKNQIIGSLIGFSLSNGIFIFFLNNVYEVIFNIINGKTTIEVYQIVLVLTFIFILLLFEKVKKTFMNI